MKRKEKKENFGARKQRPLTQAELKKISAGVYAAQRVESYGYDHGYRDSLLQSKPPRQ
jgi:hypothetical protein